MNEDQTQDEKDQVEMTNKIGDFIIENYPDFMTNYITNVQICTALGSTIGGILAVAQNLIKDGGPSTPVYYQCLEEIVLTIDKTAQHIFQKGKIIAAMAESKMSTKN